LIAPVATAVVKALYKPICCQLRITTRGPLFFHQGLTYRLGGLFLPLSLLQLLAKVHNTCVEHTVGLDLLQDVLHFQIRFKFFEGFEQLLWTRGHVEMTHPEIRSVL